MKTETAYHNMEIECHDHGVARKGSSEYKAESCCGQIGGVRGFFCVAFRGKTWVNILYLITLHPAYGFFCWGWTLGAFIAAACTFWVFPIGTAISAVFAFSWRALAGGEIWLSNLISPKEVEIPDTKLQVTTSDDQHWCCWPARAFAAVYTDVRTYTSLVYYLLIKPIVSMFCLLFVAITVGVSIGLIFNFVILASCNVCYRDIDNKFSHWTLGTYPGSLLTIPVGFLLLVVSCHIANAFTRGTTWLSRACLINKKSAIEAAKILEKCPHCNRPVSNGGGASAGNYDSTETRKMFTEPTVATDFDPERQANVHIQQKDYQEL